MVVIQNQTVMSVFVDNMTFTFRRSDCDLKKASDNEFDRGLGYLVTWKTSYTWVPGTPCVLLPDRGLGILEEQRLRRLSVSSLLSTRVA